MAEPLGPDLYRHLVTEIHDMPPDARNGNARWVMNGEWLDEVCRMAGEQPYPPKLVGPPAYLLGIPVEVRDDGGVPHLERKS